MMNPTATIDDLDSQLFYHGTKAELRPGDLIGPGYSSNYGSRKRVAYVYLTATLNAATRGAELAVGEGRGRIYTVEPTGQFEDDPNLTNKRFPESVQHRRHIGEREVSIRENGEIAVTTESPRLRRLHTDIARRASVFLPERGSA
jgi:hypothetical protein